MQSFGEQWNIAATKHGLKSIDFIKPQSNREKQALARLGELRRDYSQTVPEFLVKVCGSAFLTGAKGFRAHFDWVIKPDNFVKIMEGTYENHKGKSNGLRR